MSINRTFRFMLFLSLILMDLFFTLTIFSDEINVLDIKLQKLTRELSLNADQQKKMMDLIKKEDEDIKKHVLGYDIINDKIEKIILILREKYNNKEKELLTFLSDSQYDKYLEFKSISIRNKFTFYLIKGLELNPKQSLELDLVIPVIIKKLEMLKQVPDVRSDKPENDNDKKNMKIINDYIAVLDKEINSGLDSEQSKLYQKNREDIFKYLLKDILGFDDGNDQKGGRGGNKGGSRGIRM